MVADSLRARRAASAAKKEATREFPNRLFGSSLTAGRNRLRGFVCAHARSHTTTVFVWIFECDFDSLASSASLASIDTDWRVALPVGRLANYPHGLWST